MTAYIRIGEKTGADEQQSKVGFGNRGLDFFVPVAPHLYLAVLPPHETVVFGGPKTAPKPDQQILFQPLIGTGKRNKIADYPLAVPDIRQAQGAVAQSNQHLAAVRENSQRADPSRLSPPLP